MFKTAELKMWGNGSYRPRNLKAGTPAVGEVNPITQFYFAMGIRGLAKLSLGNMEEAREKEGKER